MNLQEETESHVLSEVVGELPAELSVVVPCFNERENIPLLLAALSEVLKDIRWEVIFIDDDSPDGTAELARQYAGRDSRVRCIQRIGRRGLSSATVEGMLSSSAPYVAVMDADLQHDERLLPQMLEVLRSGDWELVVGSRYVQGGSSGQVDASRLKISRMACSLAERVLKVKLADPMSGFFMLTRDLITRTIPRVSGCGFKILLDIIASADREVRVKELPYSMRARAHGDSKLDAAITLEYVNLLLDKWLGRLISVRFLMFLLVGGLGVAVHLSVLAVSHLLLDLGFALSQAVATLVAMSNNFFLNNLFTYRDRRLHGAALLKGLLSFYLACGVGAVLNVAVADLLFSYQVHWASAGLVGAVIGSVWNYLVTAMFTWKVRPSASG